MALPQPPAPATPTPSTGAAPSGTRPAGNEPLDLTKLGLTVEEQNAAFALLQLLDSDDSTEVIMNGPDETMQKVGGQRFHMPAVTFSNPDTYHKVLNTVLLRYVDTTDTIDGATPLVEGQMTLPSGRPGVPPMIGRVTLLAPPLVPVAKVTVAKKARYDLDLDGLTASGSMSPAMAEFLKAAAHARLTCVISGPTGAGKTTLLQAMARNYDPNERIVVIEDTPELRLPLADVVYLQSTDTKPGMKPEDRVTIEWLVKVANRMRTDRILVGECRGPEIGEWLIAANSGADGSATTIHADNPRRALDKVMALATKSQRAASESTLRREIASTVDLVIQLSLIDGRHFVTHIEEIDRTVRHDGVMVTTTLFAYDRNRGVHEAKGQPSDGLQDLLRSRGVPVNMAWFRNR